LSVFLAKHVMLLQNGRELKVNGE